MMMYDKSLLLPNQLSQADNPYMKSDDPRSPTTWEREAARILRAELVRFGLDKPSMLRPKLAELGVIETERNLTNKIARGKFSFTFFLQCMSVLDVGLVNVGAQSEVLPATNRKKPPGRPKVVKDQTKASAGLNDSSAKP